jgi:hypothetical protein
MMFSGYARSDFVDPGAAILSMCSVFEDYSDAIIKYATDVKTGMQRRRKWPPTISEVVTFCDGESARAVRMNRYKNWGKQDTPPIVEGPQPIKPTLEEMHAKYGKDWGITDFGNERLGTAAKPAPTWEQIGPMYAGSETATRLTAPNMTRVGREMLGIKINPSIAVPLRDGNIAVSNNLDQARVALDPVLPLRRAA